MSKKKRYTATDAAKDTVELLVVTPVELVVVTPVVWLLGKTFGWVLDVT